MLKQQLLCDGIAQFYLPVERRLFVVLDQFTQSLKLRRANGEQSVFAFDTAMFYLSVSPVGKQQARMYAYDILHQVINFSISVANQNRRPFID